MATAFFSHPPNGPSPNPRERRGKALEAEAWGTPTSTELAALLDSIQAALEGPTARRCKAIALLSHSYAMLLRCQAALPAVLESPYREEKAA